ncbi:hypothetical protein KR038_007831, partial [Drosophila bunnanda]
LYPQVVCLLITLGLDRSRAATTILHGNGPDSSAISHQSFTRLSSAQPLILQRHEEQQHHLLVPAPRIVNSQHRAIGERQQVERFSQEDEEQQQLAPISHHQTPAHLTYSARPVVHQMLPRIKPVRNISFASLIPGPRSLATQRNLSPV